MGSSTSKVSGTHRLKSRILNSSCLAISPTQEVEEATESKKNQDEEESGASGSNPNPIPPKKTRFGSGSKLNRTINLDPVQNNESTENNVTIETNINTEHQNVTSNENDNNVSGNGELRRNNRRVDAQELPLENSVSFIRTLSVERLRDRVLRRSSSNNVGMLGAEERNGGDYNAQISEERALSVGDRNRRGVPDLSSDIWPEDLRRNGYGGGGGFWSEGGVMQLRNRSGHEMLEHRSVFHERRRRIRSQVRALQRLGSRFENLSGHERSCILSGHHRTERCTCRASNRIVSANDDNTGNRASISRIVILAEALFEVLDEIHQQSVALTSQPSFSSIGSVPAPKEIVECLPVKIYQRPQKYENEEAAQCYICLVEYEEGDSMRILPCNHEFHRTCIDKWLKEIHRVCPLCRGDVCKYGAFGALIK